MEWKPIETAPECWMEDREVLLYLRGGGQFVSKHRMDSGTFWAIDWEYPLDATHWMPLPPPPRDSD